MKAPSAVSVPSAPEAQPERWFDPANLVTMLRIPLGVLAWFFASDRAVMTFIVVTAGLSDAADGILARLRERRLFRNPSRRIGVWLDPLCDKFFMISAAVALCLAYGFPLWLLPLILTRDLALAVAVALRFAVGGAAGPTHYQAAAIGKATTGAQFLTLLLLLTGHLMAVPMAIATSVLGVAASIYYVRRALQRKFSRPADGNSAP